MENNTTLSASQALEQKRLSQRTETDEKNRHIYKGSEFYNACEDATITNLRLIAIQGGKIERPCVQLVFDKDIEWVNLDSGVPYTEREEGITLWPMREATDEELGKLFTAEQLKAISTPEVKRIESAVKVKDVWIEFGHYVEKDANGNVIRSVWSTVEKWRTAVLEDGTEFSLSGERMKYLGESK